MLAKPVEIMGLPQESELVKNVLLIIPLKLNGQSREQLEQLLQMEYERAAKRNGEISGSSQIPFASRLLDKFVGIKNAPNAKSVAIYISRDEEQTYYLNYTLDAKIILNAKFNIITLLKAFNKNLGSYLAVILTGCYARIYSASGGVLKKIATLVQEANKLSSNDNKQLKCHISNGIAQKKQILSHYIKTIDDTLHAFLETQPLPVFVLGSHNAALYFSENSNYRLNIIEIFTTNYTDLNEEFISGLVNLWAKHNLESARETTEN